MKFRNISTSEVINVSNIRMKEGRIFFTVRGKGCGTKFFNRNVCLVLDEHAEGGTYLKVADGWVLLDEPKERKGRTPKAPKAPKQQPKVEEVPVEEVQPVDEPKVDDVHSQPAPQPKVEEVKQVEVVGDEFALAVKLMQMLKGAGGVDEEAVRNIVRSELGKQEVKEVVHKIKVAELPEYEMPDGKEPCPLFKTVLSMVVNDRVIGRFPWLYGPAGSGKSTMARQIADALGLPFYSVSSLQQKYELEGYSDAVGEFVQTSFYKAMAEGGIFCFDEMSTTSGEVQVAFNTAAAQLVYNFPKMGMVKAHPDFHIIAADNSTGRGGDKRYISRFQLDASTLDRYSFVEVGYTKEHDLFMANGDKELVRFIEAVRKAIDEANTSYLATPRASKAIKALQATGMSDKDAVWYGLCSGWNKQDIRTIAARLSGTSKYFAAIHEIADNC